MLFRVSYAPGPGVHDAISIPLLTALSNFPEVLFEESAWRYYPGPGDMYYEAD